MRIVVTGGAGFLGSHLSEVLLNRGDEVVCVDDLSSGTPANIAHLAQHPRFEFHRADVGLGLPVGGQVDAVAHLASPASPSDYYPRPLETMAVGSRGTEHALNLADRWGARFLLTSSSEVYGEPLVHPQHEEYWGNVNPIGVRSVYDEAKRFAEALTWAYRRTLGVNAGVVRIFNTYGPRMRPDDGRVVTSFIVQALNGEPLTIYGDGTQTRSFCYVDDLVRGLVAMLDSADPGPINLGNPDEQTINELAHSVLSLTNSSSAVAYHPLPVDDPTRRRPDIARAQELLGWTPVVSTEDGLRKTIEAFRNSPRDYAASQVSPGSHSGTPTAPMAGRTYYLDPAGSDDADGLTPRSAWRSLERANRSSLRPGDRLRLRGGAQFVGMLHLENDDAGDPNRPVVISSFGDGRATIVGNAGSAIYVHNTAGVEIRNLSVVGGPQTSSSILP